MEKEYSLQCIDYAIKMTKERSKQTPDLAKLDSVGHFTEAIVQYMFNGDSKGFSSFGDGRKYIMSLTKEDLEEQLLKHVVKSEVAKKGMVGKLGTNKTFDDDLEQADVQILMYKALNEMDMSGIKYILDKYPILYKGLAANFVEDRYFNYNLGEEKLDAPFPDNRTNYYYKKIDEYYKNLKKDMEETYQK